MSLPSNYAWLGKEPGPKMILEALRLYGIKELAGRASNPVILAWADELAVLGTAYARWVSSYYDDDSIPWCGLGMAVVAQRANPQNLPERRPPPKFLSAGDWANWGVGVATAMLGDVLVFHREGGNHVGLYVGHDDPKSLVEKPCYHVLGFNQGDAVSIVRIDRKRCDAIRRPVYQVQPANVRPVALAPAGMMSRNEA